jgi:hypothetical protein
MPVGEAGQKPAPSHTILKKSKKEEGNNIPNII